MNSENLANLIAGAPATDVEFHTGVVEAFDQATGANTVRVAGTPLVDLQMMNIGDTTNLAAGDVVQVIRIRTNYFVLGRIVPPHSARFASQTFDFASAMTHEDNFAITTVGIEYAIQAFVTPAWANRMIVHTTVDCSGRNDRGVADYLYAAVTFNGFVVSHEQLQNVDAGETGSCSSTYAQAGDFAVDGHPFTVAGRIHTNGGTWTTSALNSVTVSTSIVYRRT